MEPRPKSHHKSPTVLYRCAPGDNNWIIHNTTYTMRSREDLTHPWQLITKSSCQGILGQKSYLLLSSISMSMMFESKFEDRPSLPLLSLPLPPLSEKSSFGCQTMFPQPPQRITCPLEPINSFLHAGQFPYIYNNSTGLLTFKTKTKNHMHNCTCTSRNGVGGK